MFVISKYNMMIDFDSIDGIKDIINIHRNYSLQIEQHQQQQLPEQKTSLETSELLSSGSSSSLIFQQKDEARASAKSNLTDKSHRQSPTVSQTYGIIQADNNSFISDSDKSSSNCRRGGGGQPLNDKSMSSHSPETPSSPSLSCPHSPCTATVANTSTSINNNALYEETNPQSIKAWRKNFNLLSCLLITANVGTIFEESTLLELWFRQLKDYLIKIKPNFVAIHCQEIGGKNFESSIKNVSIFTEKILGDHDIIGDYSRARIFLDENFESLENFTALGSLYLIQDSVENIKLYNFKTAQYEAIQDKVIHKDRCKNKYHGSNKESTAKVGKSDQNHTASRETEQENENNNNEFEDKGAASLVEPVLQSDLCDFVEKVKFPEELFPGCRSSRKGFMRTRWLLNDSQLLDLVNVHLFHDASNLIAMEATPSLYAKNRQKALQFALKRLSAPLENRNQSEVPLFIFGDFNFRLDTNKVIEKITEGVSPSIRRKDFDGEPVELIYRRESTTDKPEVALTNSYASGSKMNTAIDPVNMGEDVVMTIGKKVFDCENLDGIFRETKNTKWLLEFDNELNSFKNQLFEFRISFNPSYPFKEDESGGYSYMKTRCPAWCDRVLFNSAGFKMIFSRREDAIDCYDSEKRIESIQKQGDIIYRLMGNSVPMGDHKPVLLYCQLDLSAPT